MGRGTWVLVAAACAMVLGILTVYHAAFAQRNAVSTEQVSPEAAGEPIYNPYPAGILPPDLVSEIERVRREVNSIFEEALGEWRDYHLRL